MLANPSHFITLVVRHYYSRLYQQACARLKTT